MSRTKIFKSVSSHHARAVFHQVFEESLTPSSVPAVEVVEEAFTVTGVKSGDTLISVVPPASMLVGMGGAYVSADDEVTIYFSNPTAGALVPVAGTYQFTTLS